MDAIFPIFASLFWFCLGASQMAQLPQPSTIGIPNNRPPGASGGDSNSGDGLLHHVAATLATHSSIAAKVRYKVDLLGQSLLGSGQYAQQGRGPAVLLRFELNTHSAAQPSICQRVCDGANLWTLTQVGDRQSLSQIDIARLKRAQPKSPATPLGAAWLALGGLTKLMGGLEESFHFGPVAKSQLDQLSVWTLEGQWKPTALAKMSAQAAAVDPAGKIDPAKLAPNMPDRVVLYVGCDDFFPYRIEYWRSEGGAKTNSANPKGRLLLVMEFYEVRLNGPVDPKLFIVGPSPLKPVDETDAFLARFGLEEGGVPSGAKQNAPPRR